MKLLFTLFLAAFLPWLIFLFRGNIGEAFIALIMQATLIGWPFATVWAWRTVYPGKHKPKKQ